MAAGKKTGGRRKGTPNKRTEASRALVARATAEGISPLDVMLGAMREAWEKGDKGGAAIFARDAAPYMHPKLSAVQHSGDNDNPVAFNIVSGVPREAHDDDDSHANGADATH